jgi:D-alanyl-D-alanine carboxypeptidase
MSEGNDNPALFHRLPSQTHPSWAYAAGAITSTARDLSKFNQALLNGSLGFDAIASFERTAASNGFTSIGMQTGTLSGESYFSHAGVIEGGYSALNAIFPMDRSSVALLCNVINPGGLAAFLGGTNGIRPAMLGSRQ